MIVMESCVAGVGGNVQPDLMELFYVSGTKAGLVRTEGRFVTAPIGADDFHDQPGLRFWEAFPGVPAPSGSVSNAANRTGLGLGVEPNVAGLAISADGKTIVAANNYNDSISVIDTATAAVRYEYDLRPFATSGASNGTKGGTFPYSVVL